MPTEQDTQASIETAEQAINALNIKKDNPFAPPAHNNFELYMHENFPKELKANPEVVLKVLEAAANVCRINSRYFQTLNDLVNNHLPDELCQNPSFFLPAIKIYNPVIQRVDLTSEAMMSSLCENEFEIAIAMVDALGNSWLQDHLPHELLMNEDFLRACHEDHNDNFERLVKIPDVREQCIEMDLMPGLKHLSM